MRILRVKDVESFAKKNSPNQIQKNKTKVESIIKDVRVNGDVAVKKYEKKFTGANISSLKVSTQEIKKAYSLLEKNQLSAIKLSKKNLEKTESVLKSSLQNNLVHINGTKISKQFFPLTSIGCYVPGGLAKYPSSVIMSVVPAKIAGVKRIVVVSPPNKDGKIDPITLVAADMCGATEIYKTGGAQAIAALSSGTTSIKKVDKIVGPGGSFVTMAKWLVSNKTPIDMLAGPTELGIIADNTSNPEYLALDLISQAEHSKDTFCYLLTNSESLAKKVRKKISEKIYQIQRKEIVKSSLKNNGFIAICKDLSTMINLANELAPEHLQIMTKNPLSISKKITSAGLVLIGNETPSSASDYLLGSNHILPTNQLGKVRGPLSVLDFLKIHTEIVSSKKTLKKVVGNMKTFTEAEGLPNHFEAVRGRIN